jgi:hypothetical protein
MNAPRSRISSAVLAGIVRDELFDARSGARWRTKSSVREPNRWMNKSQSLDEKIARLRL